MYDYKTFVKIGVKNKTQTQRDISCKYVSMKIMEEIKIINQSIDS